jgi:uncharacterized membrane protein
MNRVFNIHCGYFFLVCSITLLTISCSKKADVVKTQDNFVPDGVTLENVTYTNYIHSVLKNNCSTCHGAAGSAPQYWFNTNTYENAAEHAVRIMETIVENSMPPAPRKPFSEIDKEMFKAWVNRGSPK